MIKKAIITAAGFGTRFLPISKTIKKEMMPVLNRPVLDYVVSDCYKAGIEEIIFVTKERDSIIQWYYSENRSLVQHLEEMHKIEKYQHFLEFLEIQERIRFRFVEQTQYDQYGTSIPVKISKKYLEGEDAFLVLMGDDFIYNPDQLSMVAGMIDTFNSSGAGALLTCIKMPSEELHKYGVVQPSQKGNFSYLKSIIEKPSPEEAKSNLVNISKYILTPEIFDILEIQKKDEKSGEYYIVDAITSLAKKTEVVIHEPQGTYLDAGNIAGWLKANLTVAWQNPELRNEIEAFMKEQLV